MQDQRLLVESSESFLCVRHHRKLELPPKEGRKGIAKIQPQRVVKEVKKTQHESPLLPLLLQLLLQLQEERVKHNRQQQKATSCTQQVPSRQLWPRTLGR